MTPSFKIGQIVLNFGVAGRIIEIDALRGLLLRGHGLHDVAVGVWYANPDKCSIIAGGDNE